MIVLHVIDIANPQGNGVAVAVKNYIEQEKKYAQIAVYNIGSSSFSFSKCFFASEFKTISELPAPYNNPDIVIFNEVYKKKYISLSKECLRRNIKYVVIPHGCLTRGAQKRKAIKKIIGNSILFSSFISNAAAIQFLTSAERMQCNFRYKASIISGNGFSVPSSIALRPQNNNIIYIGRYEILHKGLDILAKLCYEHRAWFESTGVTITLYGRDSSNELKKYKQMVNSYNIGKILKVMGPVYGNQKKEVLEKAYCFIQCSRYEGQPMGIIEALCYGVPCIVTEGTNMKNYIEENRCGVSVDDDVESIFEAIKRIVTNRKERNRMAANAMRSARGDFDPSAIACRTIDKYARIAGVSNE